MPRLLGPAQWTEIAMDGSTLPVATMLLFHDPATHHRRLLVRFPAGFERSEVGSYQTRERFLVLAGSLTIGRQELVPGNLLDVGAGVLRDRTLAPHGALTLVSFDARPQWAAAAPSTATEPLPLRHLQPPDEFCARFWDL